MAFGSCDYATMDWYCVLLPNHDGPHRSEVLVDWASPSDDERRALDLPYGPDGAAHISDYREKI